MQIWQKLCHVGIIAIYCSKVCIKIFKFSKFRYFKITALENLVYQKIGLKLIFHHFQMPKWGLKIFFWDFFCNTSNNHGTNLQNPKIEKNSDVVVVQESLINYANFQKFANFDDKFGKALLLLHQKSNWILERHIWGSIKTIKACGISIRWLKMLCSLHLDMALLYFAKFVTLFLCPFLFFSETVSLLA